MNNFEQRIANEKSIIENMVRILAEHHWVLVGADDTEDYEELNTHEAAYEQSSCADMGNIYFKKGDYEHHVLVIYGNGNDGWDLISDYTYNDNDDFDASMSRVSDWMDAQQEVVDIALTVQPIGAILKGLDGGDFYMLVESSGDSVITKSDIQKYFDDNHYAETHQEAGGYFCRSYNWMPDQRNANRGILVVHQRYDI